MGGKRQGIDAMSDTDPATLSAEDMLGYYSRCQLSPVEVLQAVTERVARLNPTLNAFAVMNPGALQAAGESESRWRSGRPPGSTNCLSSSGTSNANGRSPSAAPTIPALRRSWPRPPAATARP